jgi:hypothetical protein
MVECGQLFAEQRFTARGNTYECFEDNVIKTMIPAGLQQKLFILTNTTGGIGDVKRSGNDAVLDPLLLIRTQSTVRNSCLTELYCAVGLLVVRSCQRVASVCYKEPSAEGFMPGEAPQGIQKEVQTISTRSRHISTNGAVHAT